MSGTKANFFKLAIAVTGLLALSQFYTNCSSPYGLLVQGSIMQVNDAEMMKRLNSGGTWQIQLSSAGLSSSTGVVTAVRSLAPAGVALGPSTGAGAIAPSVAASTPFKDTAFEFASMAALETTSSEAALVSDAYTVVAVLDAAAVGNVISLNNGTRGSQELALTFTAPGVLKITHSTDAGDFTSVSQTLDVTSGPVVLGATFGVSASNLALQINGKPITATPALTGTPGDSAFLLRQLMLGDSAPGTHFELVELDVFSAALTPATLNTVERFVANKWKISGMTYIPQPKEDLVEPPVNPDFLPVQNILQTQCATCHGPGAQFYFVGLSESGLANSRWVTKGSAAQSSLYTKLSGVNANGDMPLNATSLSAADAAAIQKWINELAP